MKEEKAKLPAWVEESPHVWVDLPLEKPFRAKVLTTDETEWEFRLFRSLRVDAAPLLATVLSRVELGPGGASLRSDPLDPIAVADVLFDAFSEPPVVLAVCGYREARESPPCSGKGTQVISRNGSLLGLVCYACADRLQLRGGPNLGQNLIEEPTA